jgi:hypothetical protein
VTLDDYAAFAAGHSVFSGESFTAAITTWRKSGWLESKSKAHTISEFIS